MDELMNEWVFIAKIVLIWTVMWFITVWHYYVLPLASSLQGTRNLHCCPKPTSIKRRKKRKGFSVCSATTIEISSTWVPHVPNALQLPPTDCLLPSSANQFEVHYAIPCDISSNNCWNHLCRTLLLSDSFVQSHSSWSLVKSSPHQGHST